MSGGHWDYLNDTLCGYIFGKSPDYDFASTELQRERLDVWRRNMLEDKIISELVFDVFCLLHSYDWYASGDICQETYQKDVEQFKSKWFKLHTQKRIKELIDRSIDDAKADLYKTFGVHE